jgi:hypothetical protein
MAALSAAADPAALTESGTATRPPSTGTWAWRSGRHGAPTACWIPISGSRSALNQISPPRGRVCDRRLRRLLGTDPVSWKPHCAIGASASTGSGVA